MQWSNEPSTDWLFHREKDKKDKSLSFHDHSRDCSASAAEGSKDCRHGLGEEETSSDEEELELVLKRVGKGLNDEVSKAMVGLLRGTGADLGDLGSLAE